jgi:hypothetical protein
MDMNIDFIIPSDRRASEGAAFDEHLASAMNSQNLFASGKLRKAARQPSLAPQDTSWTNPYAPTDSTYVLTPPTGTGGIFYHNYNEARLIPNIDYAFEKVPSGSWYSPSQKVFVTKIGRDDSLYRSIDNSGKIKIITRRDLDSTFETDVKAVLYRSGPFEFTLRNQNGTDGKKLYAIPKSVNFPGADKTAFVLVDARIAKVLMKKAGKESITAKNLSIKLPEPDIAPKNTEVTSSPANTLTFSAQPDIAGNGKGKAAADKIKAVGSFYEKDFQFQKIEFKNSDTGHTETGYITNTIYTQDRVLTGDYFLIPNSNNTFTLRNPDGSDGGKVYPLKQQGKEASTEEYYSDINEFYQFVDEATYLKLSQDPEYRHLILKSADLEF